MMIRHEGFSVQLRTHLATNWRLYKLMWHYRSLSLMKNKKNKKCVKHSLWVHYVESPHSTIAFKGVKTIFTYNRWLTRRYLQISGEDKIAMLHLI
jgi:hypothetical protein